MPCSRAFPFTFHTQMYPDNLFSAYMWVCFASLARSSWCLQCVKKTFQLDVSQGSSEVRGSVLVCHFQAFIHCRCFGTMQKNLQLTRLTQFHRFNLSNTHVCQSPSPMETESFCRPPQKKARCLQPDVIITFPESFSALWFNHCQTGLVPSGWKASGYHQGSLRMCWTVHRNLFLKSKHCENEL